MTRLSHSAANKYLECAKSYDFHYNKKYRSTEQSAALLFGTAIDKATEHYAKKFGKIANDAAYTESMLMFAGTWAEQELNGKLTKLYSCTEIVYSNNDIDLELRDKLDNVAITQNYGVEDIDSTIADILERKEKVGFKKLSENDKKILNHVNWQCLNHKGIFMMKAFTKWFDENVVEVLSTQKKIELVNNDGDSVLGFADLVVRLKGYDKPVFLDVKTSARAYENDAVITKPQLPLYVFAGKHEYDNTNTAGYVVLHKNIKKNKTKICKTCGYDGSGESHRTCPKETVVGIIEKGKNKGQPKTERCKGEWDIEMDCEAIIQVIVADIPELLQENVADSMDEVNRGIKAQVFPRNYNSCVKYGGAVQCPYISICHHGCMGDLITKEDKK